jgi:hypothetical protein
MVREPKVEEVEKEEPPRLDFPATASEEEELIEEKEREIKRKKKYQK